MKDQSRRMFCFQCEQTAGGRGCTSVGVCGKDPETSALQDLLIYSLRGLAQVALESRRLGVYDESVGFFACECLFATLTNVNFDPDRIAGYLRGVEAKRRALEERIRSAGGKPPAEGPAGLALAGTKEGLVRQALGYVAENYPEPVSDEYALRSLLIIGLKGVAAYAYHTYKLGKVDDAVFKFIEEALAAPATGKLGVEDLLGLALRCGWANLKAMELLDSANTEAYGHPAPVKVPLGVKKGKAILVSGHDLKDMEELLKQTRGTGIYVYTHGEMLPAHGYPKLKAYPQLYGHYGTAWHNQRREFNSFPGAILMTSNCLLPPLEGYRGNVFTTGPVGAPGVPHISNGDFTPLIKRALELPGFPKDVPGKAIVVGYARNAVLSVAERIVRAVKEGRIRHFFLVGGCDGAKPARSYYTEFVEKTPKDTVVLTLGCGK
ncbi:MAG: hydroxylamine reductase, partial [Desulfurococcaceae archaeon]